MYVGRREKILDCIHIAFTRGETSLELVKIHICKKHQEISCMMESI